MGEVQRLHAIAVHEGPRARAVVGGLGPVRDAINGAFQVIGIYPAIKDIQDPRTGKMVPGWS